MNISYLVISKNSELLNNFLRSAVTSKDMWAKGDEIMCSWNGKHEEINNIVSQGLPIEIIENCLILFVPNC